MNLKTLALLLTAGAAAGAAYSAAARYRRASMGTLRSGLPAEGGGAAFGDDTASLGAESINPAERLQERGVGRSVGGTAAPGGGVPSDELFSSSSARGPEPIAPGLPDFTRGA
ncbi:hypothetical protein OOT46_16720 [Aquabacterium sp. A7-Y]|uniref:hypothetical protein n=1 Tax=Aquabacterium sp. A7-Y TaxID=1349605 RepID=UPI00223D2695|nr:hypothetical protein [Aquabacterium sp. A7-Y]MCW7539487.1 hypothetical protein [Aquabacterium sp. A7-Y]